MKNSKQKILFVNAILENNTPRSIRTLNFINHLKEDFEIHLLYFKFNKSIIKISGVHVHVVETKNKFRKKFLVSKTSNIFLRLLYRIMNIGNKIGDPFYFDIGNLTKTVNNLDANFKFSNIIVSIAPFSLYKIAQYSISEKITFDIGDHLYKNSALANGDSNYYFNLEKNALQNCKNIIVTNANTKIFYKKNYGIHQNKIKTISQGFDEVMINKLKIDNGLKKEVNHIIRIIYGGNFYKELRDPFPLVKAVEKFNKTNRDHQIVFDIYGGGGVKIKPGFGINILPSLDQKGLFKEIINSNYNVFIDNLKGIQTPGKIYENLALGTSMLYIKSSISTQTFKLTENCKGIDFFENNTDDIYRGLCGLIPNGDNIQCSFMLSDYSWKSLSKKFSSFLNNVDFK